MEVRSSGTRDRKTLFNHWRLMKSCLDVAQCEWGCVRRAGRVFARLHEEEERDTDHVGDGGIVGRLSEGSGVENMMNDEYHGDRFDSIRGRICMSVVAAELTFEVEVDGARRC